MMKKAFKKALHFIFPSLCLHCKDVLINSDLVCKGCSFAFELIEPASRCICCFSENKTDVSCQKCLRNRSTLRLAAACDLKDGVCTLIRHLKEGKRPYLAKTAASFMAMQLTRLDWPGFDILVPIPKRLLFQKGNHAELIANSLGDLLNIPVKNCLGRVCGGLSRSRVSVKEEMLYFLKKQHHLKDKKILLIDDVIQTGKTLRHAARILKSESSHIYGLAFAITES